MRKWFVPVLALGAGGIGAFFMTAKGRETVRGWWVTIARTPDRWQGWNASAQLELERIQKTLNQISRSLES